MEEIWKEIHGYDRRYAVSNLGNIKRLKQVFVDKTGRSFNLKEKQIKPTLHSKGYYVICLSKDGNRISIRLHRLIAKYFVDNPNNYDIVDHIDGNKLNNNYNNLRWVTQKENVLNENTFKNAVEKQIKGRKEKARPVYQLDNDYKVINKFNSAEEAAKAMNCSTCFILRCCQLRHRTAKGYHWSHSPIILKI